MHEIFCAHFSLIRRLGCVKATSSLVTCLFASGLAACPFLHPLLAFLPSPSLRVKIPPFPPPLLSLSLAKLGNAPKEKQVEASIANPRFHPQADL